MRFEVIGDNPGEEAVPASGMLPSSIRLDPRDADRAAA